MTTSVTTPDPTSLSTVAPPEDPVAQDNVPTDAVLTGDRPVVDIPTLNPSTKDEATSDDVLHQHGLEHMQAGEWGKAEQCFAELAARHPDNDYYADLLSQARFKVTVDESPPERQGHRILTSRRVTVLVGLTLIMALGIFSVVLYQRQIAPVFEQQAQAQRQQQLLDEGRQLLADGQFDEAQKRFEEVLTFDPDNTTAQRAVREINRRDQLNEAYDQAIAQIKRGEWRSALTALEAIRQQSPGFRDVQEQIDRIQPLVEYGNALALAQQQVNDGNWSDAIEQLLTLRTETPDSELATVNALLFESYMNEAQATLLNASQNPENEVDYLHQAIVYFTQALEIEPADMEAAMQLTLAQEYLAGLEAYQLGSWESAGIHLANVYPIEPTYAGGRAAELLQEAYVEIGNRYRGQKDPGFTAQRYRQAIALSLVGDGRPLPDGVQEQLRMADDLYTQKQYLSATIGYANILAMMGFDDVTAGELAAAEIGTGPAPQTYTVRANDTLSKIARQFNTTVEALIESNAIITNRNLIRPGWELVIPASKAG